MLLTWVALAGAQDVSTSGTFRTEGRYYQSDRVLDAFPDEENVYDYAEIVGRLNLLADENAWQVGTQIDGVGMLWHHYYLDDVKTYEFDLLGEGAGSPVEAAFGNVEKVWLTHRFSAGEVQVGDGYASFGRGLALNVVKNTDIDVDTSIRGAKTFVSKGDWDIQALAGLTNEQQVLQDNPNRQLRGNRNHLVAGVRADRWALGPMNLGLHTVAVELGDSIDADNPLASVGEAADDGLDVMVAGATAELYAAGVDWYVEGDAYRYNDPLLFADGELEPGYAAYASASFYPGRLAILIEGKRYKNTERINAVTVNEGYELMVGPSLEYERVITEDSSAAVNSNDIYGGRARVNLSLRKGKAIPYVAVGAYRDLELGGLHFNRAPETIVHPVVGLDLQGDMYRVIFNSGYRLDSRDDGYGQDRLAHIDATWAFPLPKHLHGELIWDAYRFQWGDNAIQQHDFTTSSLAFATFTQNGWAFIVYNDWTNDPLVDSTGNITDQTYLAGEVQWQPTDSTTLKAFYGAYKAGIRCAGGQCKRLPGFEGGRVTATVTF